MKKLADIKILSSKDEVSFSEINQLTENVGWGKLYYRTEEQWRRALAASSHIAYAKTGSKLICFGRILEDGQMCMFYDVCVHSDFQKQSIGSLLMNNLIEKIKNNNYVSVGLFVWTGNATASEFYKKFGFEQSFAMELKKYMRKNSKLLD